MGSFDDAERRLADKLGSELRRLREHKDLTQGALARKAGHYSRSTIATVETGWGKCSLKLIRGCDDTLEAGGALVKLYFELKEAQARAKNARSDRAGQPQWPQLEDHRRPARLPSPLLDVMGQVHHRAERAVRYGNPGEAVLEECERLVEQRALGYATEPPGPFLHDLLLDVDDVATLLDACRSPGAQRRLLHVLGQLAALVSVVANDLGVLRAASDWMRTARLAAVETGDQDLRPGPWPARASTICTTAALPAGRSNSPTPPSLSSLRPTAPPR